MSKRTKPLLLLALFAGLAVLTRELPECMALADDVSNNGDVRVFVQQALVRKVSRSDADGAEFFALPRRRPGPPVRAAARVEPVAVALSRDGRILPSLFQIQRK